MVFLLKNENESSEDGNTFARLNNKKAVCLKTANKTKYWRDSAIYV